MLLFDDGSTSSVAAVRFGIGFPPHAGRFALSEFQRANYECFGENYMLRFSRGGRALQAHIAFGRRAGGAGRRQALSILDSLRG